MRHTTAHDAYAIVTNLLASGGKNPRSTRSLMRAFAHLQHAIISLKQVSVVHIAAHPFGLAMSTDNSLLSRLPIAESETKRKHGTHSFQHEHSMSKLIQHSWTSDREVLGTCSI